MHRYREIDAMLLNLKGVVKFMGGYKLYNGINSISIRECKYIANSISNCLNTGETIDNVSDRPDILIRNIYNQDIIAIEHFRIGSRNYKRSKGLENYTMTVYSSLLRNNIYNLINIDDYIKNTFRKNELTYSTPENELIESFKYGYNKHIRNLSTYINNIRQSSNSMLPTSSNNLWFLIDSIDTIIINKVTGEEASLIEVPEILGHIYNNKSIGGIIYLGIANIFIIPYNLIKKMHIKKYKHKYSTSYKVYRLNRVQILTDDDIDITHNQRIKLYSALYKITKDDVEDLKAHETLNTKSIFFKHNGFGKIINIETLDK